MSSMPWRRASTGAACTETGWGGGRVVGGDETGMRVRGQAQLVGFVVDQESGKTVGVDLLVERDSAAFHRWLQRYTRALGVEVLVTDDLNTYKPVSHHLGACRFSGGRRAQRGSVAPVSLG